MNNHYNKDLRGYARNHRNDGTKAEIRIWCELLRNKQFCNFSFLRQRPIENFIVDFYCKDLKHIIEVDGLTHQWEENVEKDQARENKLKSMGYHILRFNDDEVMNDIINVQRTIQAFIETHAPIKG